VTRIAIIFGFHLRGGLRLNLLGLRKNVRPFYALLFQQIIRHSNRGQDLRVMLTSGHIEQLFQSVPIEWQRLSPRAPSRIDYLKARSNGRPAET
jgi:hypothetical protein